MERMTLEWFVSGPQDMELRQYRALKTVVLESLEEGTNRLPSESVKLLLMKKYQDLPNPATYRCEVDMDFPYSETVLPVGKRKLMAYLVS